MMYYSNILARGDGRSRLYVNDGIEIQAELDFLSEAGVDLVQGFYLGRPTEAPGKLNEVSFGEAHHARGEV